MKFKVGTFNIWTKKTVCIIENRFFLDYKYLEFAESRYDTKIQNLKMTITIWQTGIKKMRGFCEGLYFM